MSHPICLSTGLVYKLENDRNKMIALLKQFHPDGIEINFALPEYLFDFKASKATVKYLNSLEFVSIHLPWADISYDKNALCQKIVKKVNGLSKQFRINNLVVHPLQITDFSIFSKFNSPVSIENEDPKMPRFYLSADFKSIFDQNPKLYFNFDFAHAKLVSNKNVENFITKYQDRILEIHLSSLRKTDKDHRFLKPRDSVKNRELIKKLKQIKNAAIVLESVAKNKNDLQNIVDDIKYVRDL